MDLFKDILLMIVGYILVALLIALVGCSNTIPPNTSKVAYVIDGDTFVLTNGKHIRLWGVDCPESSQMFGDSAKRFTRQFLGFKRIYLKIVNKDKYGRTVAKVYNSKGIMLQTGLIANGLAWDYHRYSHSKVFKQLQQIAKNHKIGLWGYKHTAPWIYRNKVN